MGTRLTLRQTITIATNSAVSPLKASSLVKEFGKKGSYPLSLLSARDGLEAQSTVFILSIRDFSIIHASSSYASLVKNWNALDPAWVPKRASLVAFFKLLDDSGLVVKELSKDWRNIAITGKAGSFGTMAGTLLTTQGLGPPGSDASAHVITPLDAASEEKDWAQIAGGLATWAGLLIGTGAVATAIVAASPALPFIAAGYVLSSALAGAAIGNGVYGLVTLYSGTDYIPNPGYTVPSAPLVTLPTEVYGVTSQEDADAAAARLLDLPPLDAGSIPVTPPAPPICPTAICPVVPVCPPAPPPPCLPGPPPTCVPEPPSPPPDPPPTCLPGPPPICPPAPPPPICVPEPPPVCVPEPPPGCFGGDGG